jgi:hypothetical protein
MEKFKTELLRLTQAIKNSNYDEQLHLGSLENNNYDLRYDERDDFFYYKDVESIEEFLCFVDNDLVRYNKRIEILGYKPIWDENGYDWFKGEEVSLDHLDVIGKNDEIADYLGDYINTFYSMDEIEEHFEGKPKFINYIKTNLMHYVKNYETKK